MDEVPLPYRVCLNAAHKMCRKMCAEDVPPEGNASASNTWSQRFQVTSHSFSDPIEKYFRSQGTERGKKCLQIEHLQSFFIVHSANLRL